MIRDDCGRKRACSSCSWGSTSHVPLHADGATRREATLPPASFPSSHKSGDSRGRCGHFRIPQRAAITYRGGPGHTSTARLSPSDETLTRAGWVTFWAGLGAVHRCGDEGGHKSARGVCRGGRRGIAGGRSAAVSQLFQQRERDRAHGLGCARAEDDRGPGHGE